VKRLPTSDNLEMHATLSTVEIWLISRSTAISEKRHASRLGNGHVSGDGLMHKEEETLSFIHALSSSTGNRSSGAESKALASFDTMTQEGRFIRMVSIAQIVL
jgi:hypothetical protein